MKPNTRNQGANDERTATLAHFRRLKRQATNEGRRDWIDQRLIRWALRRNERYNRKAGGLGK